MSLKVGVLALQGAVAEHISMLTRVGAETAEVRLPWQLDGLDGLVIPGGESTTISRLMAEHGFMEPIRQLAAEGFPIMGSCAGLILLARLSPASYPQTLELMDMEVKRNAFGRQVDSFEADLPIPTLGTEPFHCVFIRAPVIEATGPGVETLCKLPDGGGVVAAAQGNLVACAFHPELTDDLRFHRYFLDIVARFAQERENAQAKSSHR
jgi:5'-phosphate synthase pdxT subunit